MEHTSHARRNVLQRLDEAIASLEAMTLGLAIIAMAVNTIANVLGRYVLAHSLYFSEELNEILMVTATFAGLGYVTRKGRHIRMSAVYDQVPEPARRWLMAVIALTTAAAMFLLAWHAWGYVAKIAARGRLTPAMQLPLWTTYVVVVSGFALAGIQYLCTALANLTRHEGVWVSWSQSDAFDDPEISKLTGLDERSQP